MSMREDMRRIIAVKFN